MADLTTPQSGFEGSGRSLDIVVPTHGRPDLLHRLLSALAPQIERAPSVAVTVVNDGTHDESYAKLVKGFEPWLDYIVLERSRGPAHARNLGANRSEADFIAFTDDDCCPPPHWLDWLLSLIASFPDVDVFGGTTNLPSPRERMSHVERFSRLNGLHPRPRFEDGTMFCLPTANVAVRRATFVESGGFDEEFRYAAGEDLEFFYRLRIQGYRFYIDPLWWTEHPVELSLLPFLKRRYRYGYGIQQHKNRTTDSFHFYLDHNATRWKLARRTPDVFGQAWRKYRAQQRSSVLERISLSTIATGHFLAQQLGALRARQVEASLPKGPKEPEKPIELQRPQLLQRSHRPEKFGLVLGAMKCGTSAMFGTLARHPEVSAAKMKEPRFFCTDGDFSRGLDWYLDLFAFDPNRHRIAVEACTRNAALPQFFGAPKRMASTGRQFRLIYIARNPIDRIQSHYLHGAVNDFGLVPLREGVDSYAVDLSRYHYQLQPYREQFGRDAILVIAYDDWKSGPRKCMERVCAHFGIGADVIPETRNVHSSAFHYKSKLTLDELERRGLRRPELNRGNVLTYLQELPANIKSNVELAVESNFRLSAAQVAAIRVELADEMSLLSATYGIDVARWGFCAAERSSAE